MDATRVFSNPLPFFLSRCNKKLLKSALKNTKEIYRKNEKSKTKKTVNNFKMKKN